jgi:hypothetical protein
MNLHFLQSSYREKLIEHLFIGELLKHSWANRGCALQIAKPEVDNCGYDLIAEEGRVVRHIQLKATHRKAKAASQKVHIALAEKPAGCVVWVYFDEDTLELGPFLFFGGAPGGRLPSLAGLKVGKHTKANSTGVKAERVNIRVVPRNRFKRYQSVSEIYEALFVGGGQPVSNEPTCCDRVP